MSGHAALVERLGAEDRAVQREACDEALRLLQADAHLRDRLLRELRSGTPRARFSAAWVLFHERPSLRVLPALLASLELDDKDLRWSAASLLALLGRTESEVLPVLQHEIRDASSPRRRRMAIYAARELGPEHPETVRALVAALADPSADVRRAALTSFAKLTDPGDAAVEAALAVLEGDPDPRMRRIAAVVLPELAQACPDRAGAIAAGLAAVAATGEADLARIAGAAAGRLQAR